MTSELTHGRRTDAVANHTRILSAARAVFAERGLDMEVNEIAERAGVGVGTLYRHFANRDDMVCAILMQTFEDVLAHLRSAAEIEDPGAALRQIPYMLTCDQPVFAAMHDPRSAKLLQDMKQQMSQPMSDEIIDLLAGLVQRGIRAGAFRADLDPPTTAAAILGSIGVAFELFGAKRPLVELADRVADLISHMVAAH